jgi:hypothetical protein
VTWAAPPSVSAAACVYRPCCQSSRNACTAGSDDASLPKPSVKPKPNAATTSARTAAIFCLRESQLLRADRLRCRLPPDRGGLLRGGAAFGDGCWTLGPPGGTGPPGTSGAPGSLGRTGSETPSPPTGLTGVCVPSPRGGNGTICPRGRPAWLPRSRERAVTVSLRSHRRRRMARSTSLAASFLARSCLLSYVRLPRASASSTLTLPSLK